MPGSVVEEEQPNYSAGDVTTFVSPATCAAAVVTFVLAPPVLWFAAHDLLTASLKVSVPRTAVSMPSATAIKCHTIY